MEGIHLVGEKMCEECDAFLGKEHRIGCSLSGKVTPEQATEKFTTLKHAEDEVPLIGLDPEAVEMLLRNLRIPVGGDFERLKALQGGLVTFLEAANEATGRTPLFNVGDSVLVDQGVPGEVTDRRWGEWPALPLPADVAQEKREGFLYAVKPPDGDQQHNVPEYNLMAAPAEEAEEAPSRPEDAFAEGKLVVRDDRMWPVSEKAQYSFTGSQINELLMQAAGAASGVFLRADEKLVMPAEEVAEAVRLWAIEMAGDVFGPAHRGAAPSIEDVRVALEKIVKTANVRLQRDPDPYAIEIDWPKDIVIAALNADDSGDSAVIDLEHALREVLLLRPHETELTIPQMARRIAPGDIDREGGA